MSLLEIVKDLFGNRIQVIDISKLDYYDVNLGADMGVVLVEPTDGIEVINDLIPFPENIDEADEGIKIYGIEVQYHIDEPLADAPAPSTGAKPVGTPSILEFMIGYFEFDELEDTADFSTDLIEEIEERLCTLRIGGTMSAIPVWNGTANTYGVFNPKIQLSDAIVFPNGFDFPLNPSLKIVWYKGDTYNLYNLANHEDLITFRIFYKKVKRPKNIFTKILSLFRQNISG